MPGLGVADVPPFAESQARIARVGAEEAARKQSRHREPTQDAGKQTWPPSDSTPGPAQPSMYAACHVHLRGNGATLPHDWSSSPTVIGRKPWRWQMNNAAAWDAVRGVSAQSRYP